VGSAQRAKIPDPPTSFGPERTRFPSLPAVCVTNKLERSIATLVPARNTILRLSHNDAVTFTSLINYIGFPKGKFMTALKKIQLVYSENSFVANLLFASMLPVLANLTITIDARDMFKVSRERDPWDEKGDSDRYLPSYKDVKAASRSHVLNTFGLSEIGGCKALTRLTFQMPNFASVYEIGWIEYWDVDHVAKMICQESFMEGNAEALSVEMICNYKGKPRRLRIGKYCQKYTGLTT
jgi:hypothetical protein